MSDADDELVTGENSEDRVNFVRVRRSARLYYRERKKQAGSTEAKAPVPTFKLRFRCGEGVTLTPVVPLKRLRVDQNSRKRMAEAASGGSVPVAGGSLRRSAEQLEGDSDGNVAGTSGTPRRASRTKYTEEIETETEEEADMICIKVKDLLGITPVCGVKPVQTLMYPPTATFGQLVNDVSEKFSMAIGDFELVYQARMDLYEFTSMPPDQPLTAANLVPNRDKAYCVTINGCSKRRKQGRTAKESFSGSGDNDLAQYMAPKETYENADGSTECDSDFGCEIPGVWEAPIRRDFVGLKNTNMTCYLNSLIQSLWFTPEFRNLIYKYVHQPEKLSKKSICVPLQNMFLKLQFSMRESIETEELTRTFGWNSRENWNQHDIEELMNLLMEHLTIEFKESSLDGMIEALYFGQFSDYVKCLECKNRNVNSSPFLVVPLPIRNFGSPLEEPTLECALQTFVTPETLDGSNKYNCSRCNKPCDAHKGLMFQRLPYILSFQLKRFEYNYMTGRKSKLNEKIVFPVVLNMNPYVDKSGAENSSPDVKPELVQPPKTNKGDVDGVRGSHSRPAVSLTGSSGQRNGESKETPDTVNFGSSKEVISKKLEEVRTSSGNDVYQLYAVLVHRGGLTGGHYIAYILDFETYRWYRCDDSYVRKADCEDIEASFGGCDDDKEPTSAYMLMYRRYDAVVNTLPCTFDEIPSHVQDLWKLMEENEKSAHDEEELEKNTIRISAHFRPPGTWDVVSTEVNIPKGLSTLQSAGYVYQNFFPDKAEPEPENVRLCRFDKDLGVIENSYDGMNDQYLSYTLRNPPPVTKNEGLMLEVKESDQTFPPYASSDLVFIAQFVSHKMDDLIRVDEIHMTAADSVGGLKNTIALKIEIPLDNLTVLVQGAEQKIIRLDDDEVTLGQLKLDKVNQIFVENIQPRDMLSFEAYAQSVVYAVNFEFEVLTSTKDCLEVAEVLAKPIPNGVDIIPNGIDPEAKEVASKRTVANGEKVEENLRNKLFAKLVLRRSEDGVDYCQARVDGRMSLAKLSEELSKFLKVEEKDFIIYKADKEEETELVLLSETLKDILPFELIRIRFGHRLQENEGRVEVYILDLESSPETPNFLGEVVLSLRMTTDEVKTLLLNQFSEALSGLEPTSFRVRKRLQGTPAKILKAEGKVIDIFTAVSIHGAEICVQILHGADEIVEQGFYPLMLRHWKPAELTLEPPKEVVIFYDHSQYMEELLSEKLPELLGIPKENLEVAKPDTTYPYNMNPIKIQGLTWFPLIYPARKSLYVYNDDMTLVVRDKTEELGAISAADEKRWRDEHEAEDGAYVSKVPYAFSPPKKETGLRINLNNSDSS